MAPTVVGLPRVASGIRCPYCRADCMAICRRPADHDVLHTCGSCLGTFVIRFDVEVRVRVLTVQNESDRVADEQEELRQLERQRNAERRVS